MLLVHMCSVPQSGVPLFSIIMESIFILHPNIFAHQHTELGHGNQEYAHIGLFKMFSRWIWGIFNIQIQSDRGHKLMLFMFQNKDKDLLGIYQHGCDPFFVSLLTDRHLKVHSNSILFTFSDKCALMSARD